MKQVYLAMPPAVKGPIKHIPYAWIAGKHYRRTLLDCRKLERLTRPEVLSLQERLLGEVLRYAVTQVPFYMPYKSLFERHRARDAIRGFPFLKKRDVQEHWDSLVPRSIRKIAHHRATTSGSTGDQLTFLEDDTTYAKEMAFIHTQWQRVGYSTRCRKARFRAFDIDRVGPDVFWQDNPIHNEVQFSPFHMSESNMDGYWERIREYAPEYLHGFPSAIDVLAEYVIRKGLGDGLGCLRGILLCSEACSDAQKSRMEKAFGKRVFTFYGHSERVVLGGECEQSRNYHAVPSYGYLEIIGSDGVPVEAGERGEIVGTGYLNRSMPLIRYKTDDTAIKLNESCACGRQWELFGDVISRASVECIYGKSGARICTSVLNVDDQLLRNVVRVQYYQDVAGELTIRIVPNALFTQEEEQRIIAEHNRRLGREILVATERVERIPLTKYGKQRRVICMVHA